MLSACDARLPRDGATQLYVERLSPATDAQPSCAVGENAEGCAPPALIENMKPVRRTKQISAAIATLLVATGCSKQPPAAAPPSAPLVEQRAADATPATDELHSSFAPGGIAATYRATFSDGKIQSLEETRQASQSGTYEFLGARLMKYRGVALGSDDTIELEFDRQGKLLVARAGDKDVSAEEITAIRDRAQSLRSHAVAQHDVQGHDPTRN